MIGYDTIVDGFLVSHRARIEAGKSQPLTYDERLTVFCFAAWIIERYRLEPIPANNGKISVVQEGTQLGDSLESRQTVSQ
jgi:hypothetical protein